MSEHVLLRTASPPRVKNESQDSDWIRTSQEVVVGKDVLELLSTSMYVDPMTIYREYTQNAADAIDDARAHGLLAASQRGEVRITIDTAARSIRIRDNGTGVPWAEIAERLSNLGASTKRGTSARGFRGVGRLAGLGYCQELIFRSRAKGEALISELRWDCRALKSALRSAYHGQHVATLVQDVVSMRRSQGENYPERFFEVELKGVIRHRDDRLLNAAAVHNYLAQVAPVPFSSEFKFGEEISAVLKPNVALSELDIRINGAEQPIFRPHRNAIEIEGRKPDQFIEFETHEIAGIDGGVAAIAWTLHHGYSGALPSRALVKGIRLRTGNMQVGDSALLEDLFPESRFNSWAVGEVHIIDGKILPNGRRDHFEQSVHLDNLLNHLAPIARDIARRCRQSSIARKWLREFELHEEAATQKAKAVKRGGLSRAARQGYIDSVAKSLNAMRKVVSTRYLGPDDRARLASRADTVESRLNKLLGESVKDRDPLARFHPQTRSAYQQIISLVYDCSSNRSAAAALIEKILSRLQVDFKPERHAKQRKQRVAVGKVRS